jgi:hypothetical protein
MIKYHLIRPETIPNTPEIIPTIPKTLRCNNKIPVKVNIIVDNLPIINKILKSEIKKNLGLNFNADCNRIINCSMALNSFYINAVFQHLKEKTCTI